MLITAAQTITLAFNAGVTSTQIKDSVIQAAEFQYIRPALTENFYEYVLQNTTAVDLVDADITTSDGRTITGKQLLTDLLRPALAYFVKYLALPDILNEVSERGGFELTANNAQIMSSASKQNVQDQALKVGNALLETMVDYIKKQKDNNVTKYVLYDNFTGIKAEKQIIGGFLIEDNTKFISKENEN